MKPTPKIISESLVIPDQYAKERIDQTLAKLLPTYSRTQIKEWIEKGNILVNKRPVKAKSKVIGGEAVCLNATVTLPCESEAQPIPLDIVFEDEVVLVINKPVGLVVHPGAHQADHTLLNALLHHAPELHHLPRAGILHRLDKNTSGLLIVAKTASALKSLTHQLKKRDLLREYQTIVYGRMISGGQVDAPIGRHPIQRKRMSVTETGKHAITHYRIAEKYRHHTRLKVRLETGRTHQIRVHMQYIHHPIVGDPTYGGRVQLSKGMTSELISKLRQFKRQALHAFALGFTHPESKEWMRFEIDLPEDMQSLIAALRTDMQKKQPED